MKKRQFLWVRGGHCLTLVLSLSGGMASPSWAQAERAQELGTAAAGSVNLASPASRVGVPSTEPVTLNFNNADIEGVARTLATLTGRTLVIDPRVKGSMTLISEKPTPPQQAYQQFLAALRLQGYTVVEVHGVSKVVPEADAKLQGGSVSVPGEKAASADSQLLTQIFQLNHESANNLVPVLRPLISPNNTINVNTGTNSLIITDYADNLQRLGRIVATLDVPSAGDVEVIPLRHAIAIDLAPMVQRLVDSGPALGGVPGQADTSFKTTLMAEPRTNAIILRAANSARASVVRSLIAKLDQPSSSTTSSPGGNIHVVYLRNADAVKLAATLRAAMAASGGAGSLGGGGGLSSPVPGGGAASPSSAPTMTAVSAGNASLSTGPSSNFGTSNSNQPSTGGQIQADPVTNSLIITAPEPQYRQLRAVIDQLDGRRAQVLVESLIVEVTANQMAQFGIQWQAGIGRKGDANIGVIGTNSGQGGTNILDFYTRPLGQALPVAGGMGVGLAHNYGGRYVLGFLAQLMENAKGTNVLSAPNLLTLDNEEAKIVVGQNLPFVSGSYANTGGNGSVNPFTTVDRKDVGLTLRVKPQINENGTIKMAVYQEMSTVNQGTLKDPNGPTTSKRSIESNILVDDGDIVVLGGLLEDSYADGVDQVPGLGDIPVLGDLFKSSNRSRQKTNLMVFLRPIVLRDAATGHALTQDRYEAIRSFQQVRQPKPATMLNSVPSAPVLPEMDQPLRPQMGTPAAQPVSMPTSAAPAPAPAPVPVGGDRTAAGTP